MKYSKLKMKYINASAEVDTADRYLETLMKGSETVSWTDNTFQKRFIQMLVFFATESRTSSSYTAKLWCEVFIYDCVFWELPL